MPAVDSAVIMTGFPHAPSHAILMIVISSSLIIQITDGLQLYCACDGKPARQTSRLLDCQVGALQALQSALFQLLELRAAEGRRQITIEIVMAQRPAVGIMSVFGIGDREHSLPTAIN